MNYYNKYLKYKEKYNQLKRKIGAGNPLLGPGIKLITTNMDFVKHLAKSNDNMVMFNLLHENNYDLINNNGRYEIHDNNGYFAHFSHPNLIDNDADIYKEMKEGMLDNDAMNNSEYSGDEKQNFNYSLPRKYNIFNVDDYKTQTNNYNILKSKERNYKTQNHVSELHHDVHGLVSKIDKEKFDELTRLFGNSNITLKIKLIEHENKYYLVIDKS
jgi:hypothetical protein